MILNIARKHALSSRVYCVYYDKSYARFSPIASRTPPAAVAFNLWQTGNSYARTSRQFLMNDRVEAAILRNGTRSLFCEIFDSSGVFLHLL